MLKNPLLAVTILALLVMAALQFARPQEVPAQLEQLQVRAEEPPVPYAREAFGQAWSDDVSVPLGHNGCDTRNDILQRDLRDPTFKPRTRNCVVQSGLLEDPYSGQRRSFVKGNTTSTLVQIDHVVALADAWRSGAWAWSEEQRRNFANDPANLQATIAEENQAKLAKAADAWLPSNPDYVCTYINRQIAVKVSYGLSASPAEYEALRRTLNHCNAAVVTQTPPPIALRWGS